jgi:secreted Zn-dependent insulinase-like peptidase
LVSPCPFALTRAQEHALFCGNDKYPGDNAFSQALARHAGSYNAMTCVEHIEFHLELAPSGLAEVLDIFAQFFISPALDPGLLEREMHAVDSEFQMSIQNDANRLACLRTALARPGSPYGRFTCGNLATLNVPGIGQALRAYQRDHLFPCNMKLAVRAPLPGLQALVQRCFGPMPASARLPRSMLPGVWTNPFPPSSDVLMVVPASPELNVLRLSWATPPMRHLSATRPWLHIEYLLNQQGPGALAPYLQARGWARDARAGLANDDGGANSSLCALFDIEVDLTKAGFAAWPQVVAACLKAVNRLAYNDAAFGDQRACAKLAYEQREPERPVDQVTRVAYQMRADREQLLSFRLDPDPLNVGRFIVALNRAPFAIMLCSSALDAGRADERAQPYDVHFWRERRPAVWFVAAARPD